MRIYYNSLLKKIVSIPVSYHRRAYGLIKKATVSDTGSLSITLERVSYDYDFGIGRSVESTNISNISTIQNDVDKVNLSGILKSGDLYYVPTDSTIGTESIKNVDYYYIPTDSSSGSINLTSISTSETEIDKSNTGIKLSSVDYTPVNFDSSSVNTKLESVDYNLVNFDSSSNNTKLSSVDYTPVNFDSSSNNTNLSTIDYDLVNFDSGSNNIKLSTLSLIDPQIDASISNETIESISLIDPQIDKSTTKETVESISLIDAQVDVASNSGVLKTIDNTIAEVDKVNASSNIKSVDYFLSEIDKSSNKTSIKTVDNTNAEIDVSTEKETISSINYINASVDTSRLITSATPNYELAEVDIGRLNNTISDLFYTTESIYNFSDDVIHNVGLSSNIDTSSRVNFNESSFVNYVRQFNQVWFLTGSVVTSSIINYTDDLEFKVISRHQSEYYKDNMDYNIPYRASFVTKNWPYYTYDKATHYNLPALLNASDTIILASRDIWITASFENGTDVFTDQWGFAIDL